MPPTRPAEERFWEKVNRTDGCWLWTAGTNNRGYGVFYPVHGKHALAHRFVYELTVRPLGPDEKIDHHYLCPKTCVNPAHLRPVTQKQNLPTTVALRGGTTTQFGPSSTCPCAVLVIPDEMVLAPARSYMSIGC